jgi:dUTP pyrophosphatase
MERKEMAIKIKTWGDLYAPKKFEQGDWIDLMCRGDHKIKAGELTFIHFGVAMELPEGWEAIIAPRSSMAKNFKIIQANSIGVIDNSFNGDNDEWGFFVVAIEDTEIKDGDRIAQFRVIKNQPEIRFDFVDSLGNSDRGGWGSTGTR